jgi:hypothetical protein
MALDSIHDWRCAARSRLGFLPGAYDAGIAMAVEIYRSHTVCSCKPFSIIVRRYGIGESFG